MPLAADSNRVDIAQIIKRLQEEKALITQAILALEAVAQQKNAWHKMEPSGKKRGRPPGTPNKPKTETAEA